MLIQVSVDRQIINVYLEQMQGDLLDRISREEVEFLKMKILQGVTAIIIKLNNTHRERRG